MKTDEKKTEYLCIGLLAHVDAGKTTLSEAILHRTGAIRSAGRVDHGDAFLDTDAMERDRGITIFSKQASFTTHPAQRTSLLGKRASLPAGRASVSAGRSAVPAAEASAEDRIWTLVDTPGHADFSTEMERVLQVLDYAVLIISAADGVTGQVRILWRLLDHYGVPVFIFVNKMDQPGGPGRRVRADQGRAGKCLRRSAGGVFGSRSGRQ